MYIYINNNDEKKREKNFRIQTQWIKVDDSMSKFKVSLIGFFQRNAMKLLNSRGSPVKNIQLVTV